jgi:hypothetical protein
MRSAPPGLEEEESDRGIAIGDFIVVVLPQNLPY